VVTALPALSGVALLWRPSASSCIYLQDGTEVIGVAGQRLYPLVDEGPAIPRIGEALVVRLWLAGQGHIALSRAGALRYLMDPFSHFVFSADLDRAVPLSLLLLAPVRQSLPTAPGAIISASTFGTGKTKLAQCLDLLAGGTGGTRALPSDTDETRKALTAALLEARPGVIFDNVTGHLRPATAARDGTRPQHR
jgi:hypothetical protein